MALSSVAIHQPFAEFALKFANADFQVVLSGNA